MIGDRSGLDPDLVTRLGAVGMLPSLYAAQKPDEVSVISERGSRTFAEVNANANRLASVLQRAGLQPGDHLALLCPNVPQFVEAFAMNLRSGYRITPINWHLKPEEVRYILRDSTAKAFIAHADFAEVAALASADADLKLRLAIGGEIAGFEDFDAALASGDPQDPAAPRHGAQMLYTSGTTGRPKGVLRPNPEPRAPQWGLGTRKAYALEGDVTLCCGPAYHTAVLNYALWDPLVAGVPIVLREKFTPLGFLETVAQHRVTHVHMVSTMFQRLLALPAEDRARFDVSSLRCVQHGAAPTPPEIKRAMIDWLGPILDEYYGASEGGGGFYITAQEWLEKPGSVGRCRPEFGNRVIDDDGRDTAPGQVGRIFFRHNPKGRFVYFNDPEKSKAATLDTGHFTVGDMGYVDEDGYLFLTGRTAETIISGGVNIYPQEIDNELVRHPAVLETCTIGAPNDEWGEEVRAVVVLRPGFVAGPALADELLAFLRPRLASFKVPRAVDFVDDIPRSEAGKVLRNLVRAPYWAGRTKQI